MEITRRIIYHEKKEAARKSGSIFKRIKASGRGRFPLMKVSGPIEASILRNHLLLRTRVSTDESQWPH